VNDQVIVRALDGRTDVDKVVDGKAKLFEPLTQRFVLSADSQSMTLLKRQCLKCLRDITRLRTNFRLGKLLAFFSKVLCCLHFLDLSPHTHTERFAMDLP